MCGVQCAELLQLVQLPHETAVGRIPQACSVQCVETYIQVQLRLAIWHTPAVCTVQYAEPPHMGQLQVTQLASNRMAHTTSVQCAVGNALAVEAVAAATAS